NITDSSIQSGGDVAIAALAKDVAIANSSITAANVTIAAGQDVNISNGSTITAQPTSVGTFSSTAAKKPSSLPRTSAPSINISAARHISVTNSSALKVLADNPNAVLQLFSQKGNITIDGSTLQAGTGTGAGSTIDIQAAVGNITVNNSTVSGDIIKARTL